MELPPAESCALDDGEEEEVQFSKQPTRGILGKFKQHKVAVSTCMTSGEHGRQREGREGKSD